MQSEPTPIEINPDSELSKRLQEAAGEPVTIRDHGVRYRVIPDVDDLWADYDPERALRAVEQSAGVLQGAGVDVAQLLRDIAEDRTQDSTGRPAEQ